MCAIKKLYMFVSIMFACLLITFSCTSNIQKNNNVSLENSFINNTNKFALYLALSDTSNIEYCFLDSIMLEEKPVFTDEDIVSYDWNEHRMVIRHNSYIDEIRKNPSALSSKPFVIVVNGERIYMGLSWSLASSAIAPSIPLIDWSEFFYKQNDISDNTYTIQLINNDALGDYRNDKRIYDALRELEKLK